MASRGGTELQRLQRGNLGHALFTVARLVDELAQAEVNAQAGARVARPALMRLLPFLDFEGVRPTELARRVDVSKQAIHQALAELVAQGLVEYADDPVDGRARLVRLTAFGGRAFRHGLGVLDALEVRLRGELGRQPVDDLRRVLGLLWPVLERWKHEGAVSAPRRPRPRVARRASAR